MFQVGVWQVDFGHIYQDWGNTTTQADSDLTVESSIFGAGQQENNILVMPGISLPKAYLLFEVWLPIQ